MGTISLGDGVEIEHGKMTVHQRRFMRIRWLLQELEEDKLKAAEDSRLVEPGTMAFVKGMITTITRIDGIDVKEGNGATLKEHLVEGLTQISLEKLEDAYRWSLPRAQLSIEEQKKVVKMCRDTGQNELAGEITKSIEEKEENE